MSLLIIKFYIIIYTTIFLKIEATKKSYVTDKKKYIIYYVCVSMYVHMYVYLHRVMVMGMHFTGLIKIIISSFKNYLPCYTVVRTQVFFLCQINFPQSKAFVTISSQSNCHISFLFSSLFYPDRKWNIFCKIINPQLFLMDIKQIMDEKIKKRDIEKRQKLHFVMIGMKNKRGKLILIIKSLSEPIKENWYFQSASWFFHSPPHPLLATQNYSSFHKWRNKHDCVYDDTIWKLSLINPIPIST